MNFLGVSTGRVCLTYLRLLHHHYTDFFTACLLLDVCLRHRRPFHCWCYRKLRWITESVFAQVPSVQVGRQFYCNTFSGTSLSSVEDDEIFCGGKMNYRSCCHNQLSPANHSVYLIPEELANIFTSAWQTYKALVNCECALLRFCWLAVREDELIWICIADLLQRIESRF